MADWKDSFKTATFRTSFNLSLSQTMIEFLCATADGVKWDRALYMGDRHHPDNWLATENAITKRGLIRRKAPSVIREESLEAKQAADELNIREAFYGYSCCELTPAGAALVELFKVTGIFVPADAALYKKQAGA